jgi:hypothetical protein
VIDRAKVIWRAPLENLRVSVLWKAHVFADKEEQARLATDTIRVDEVTDIFNHDLAHRDEPLRLSRKNINEPAARDALRHAYPEATPVGGRPLLLLTERAGDSDLGDRDVFVRPRYRGCRSG